MGYKEPDNDLDRDAIDVHERDDFWLQLGRSRNVDGLPSPHTGGH